MLTNTHIQILSNVYNIYYLITNILKFIYIYIYIYIYRHIHTYKKYEQDNELD